jgi:hypothetical protein
MGSVPAARESGATIGVRGPSGAFTVPPVHALFEESGWQMTLGERAALEGLLVTLKPKLAVEVGTLNGGSLRRIALHSEEVHAFDLNEHPGLRAECPNTVFHIGDSHELLPLLLDELSGAGRNVDFVLVDGDPSGLGVKADMDALLASPSVSQTVILVHDALNERKRAALESLPGATYVDLDFVPGHVYADGEQWCGFALVLVGDVQLADDPHGMPKLDHAELVRHARSSDAKLGPRGEMLLGLEKTNRELEAALETIKHSASWRLTAPLRVLKSRVRSRRA